MKEEPSFEEIILSLVAETNTSLPHLSEKEIRMRELNYKTVPELSKLLKEINTVHKTKLKTAGVKKDLIEQIIQAKALQNLQDAQQVLLLYIAFIIHLI